MIEMFNVSKTYPNQIEALSDIYLEVSSGEFLYIAGPTGSGKSTLLRTLSGAVKPTSGEVIVNGIRISEPRFKKIHQLRRNMGIISPDVKLLRDRSVRENVGIALEVMDRNPREISERVLEMLQEVGLAEREKDPIRSLSAGEQQRVAIARALVSVPPLILADEPTAVLDDQMTEEVMKVFEKAQQNGATILFATQDIDLIRRYPRRLISLIEGKRVKTENGEEVRSKA